MYYKNKNTKGLFGYTTGACLVTETQQRHDLHGHILLFGSLSPALLQSAAPFPNICNTIAMAIEKMYRQSISRNIHITNIISNELRSISRHTNLINPSHIPGIKKSSLQYQIPKDLYSTRSQLFFDLYSSFLNIHTHTFTCHKGKLGQVQCRLAFQRHLFNATQPVELSPRPDEEYKEQALPRWQCLPCIDLSVPYKPRGIMHPPDTSVVFWNVKWPLLDPLPPLPQYESIHVSQIQSAQRRLFCLNAIKTSLEFTKEHDCETLPIVKENNSKIMSLLEQLPTNSIVQLYNKISVELPNKNGMVVEYNPFLTYATNSNTCVSLIGSEAQCGCCIGYAINYVNKIKK